MHHCILNVDLVRIREGLTGQFRKSVLIIEALIYKKKYIISEVLPRILVYRMHPSQRNYEVKECCSSATEFRTFGKKI